MTQTTHRILRHLCLGLMVTAALAFAASPAPAQGQGKGLTAGPQSNQSGGFLGQSQGNSYGPPVTLPNPVAQERADRRCVSPPCRHNGHGDGDGHDDRGRGDRHDDRGREARGN